ncbi:ABC transporter permease [Enterocloster bolteae]|uniref:ABC transporter permease n=1 Tax=Enterocloster bolteae TaxID=208479 RepID=UPI002A7F8C8C|nr:ABC transporter permease [Enterocloster bolteae]
MPFYQRAFLYLFRKRTKTALLFLILLLVNSMILGTVMILHAAQTTQISIEKKSKAKAVCEITQDRDRISSQDISAVKQLPHITFLNRQAESPAYLSDFLPITASDSQKPENSQIHLTAYDDLEKDGPFATQNYRLTDGTLIQPQLDSSAVIHETFATVNGISIGDQIHLENEHGKTITVTVCGLFLSGNEHQQDNTLDSLYRIENQIFIDTKSYTTLFNSDQFNQLIVYTDQPGQTEALAEKLQELFGEKVEVTSSDALYQQMKAPLEQIIRITKLMMTFTLLSGTVIVSLILCMWMRSRQREMAVLISLGESKGTIFLQTFLESVMIFLLAAIGSCCLGTLSANVLQTILSASEPTLVMTPSLQMKEIATLFAAGSLVILTAVLLSLVPVLTTNPKDILSRMEG